MSSIQISLGEKNLSLPHFIVQTTTSSVFIRKGNHNPYENDDDYQEQQQQHVRAIIDKRVEEFRKVSAYKRGLTGSVVV